MQSSKNISFLLKLIIVFLALWFLYEKVFANENVAEMQQWFWTTFQKQNPWPLYLTIALMFVNWGIDAVKWRFLIKKLEDISLTKALKAIFLGITVSVFTPNRVGEYGGRVFCLETADRVKAVLATVLGNMAQLLATLIFGVLALVYYFSSHTTSVQNPYWSVTLLVLAFVSIIAFITLYLNSSLFENFFNRFSFLKKYQEYSEVFSYYSKRELAIALGYSILRYVVFTFQFYLLIRFFEVEVSLLESAAMSALTFLTMSIIPTIALTELGVRGSVAVYFFGLLSANSLGIMTAAFVLWTINLVLPALIGTVLVYNLKFFRS